METKTNLPADKAGPKDVFLHLLSIITLYVSVGSFIALLFQYVNVLIPDIVANGGYYSVIYSYESIRWALAILIVVFPVYIWTSWYLNREYGVAPEKRELKVRKWLLYFTLFLAAILIIGDLIALIYSLLQGELTARFSLKILSVLAVAGTVFGYYILDLKNKAPHKIFAYAVSAVLLVAIVSGFVIAGSPKTARLLQLDQMRLQHLQEIQGQIVNFWQQKGKLPSNLSELTDSISGFQAPKDPETGKDYEYQVKGTENFALCAEFKLPSLREDNPSIAKPYFGGYGAMDQNWTHSEGRTCFDRTIDKDFYKPPEPKR